MKKKAEHQTVVVLGASPKPERYSNQAVRLLLRHGHTVLPVHTAVSEIEGLPVWADLRSIDMQVDTVSLYLSPERSIALAADLIALRPKRVIFNPGTESAALQQQLQDQGIAVEEACTLVLLNTEQF